MKECGYIASVSFLFCLIVNEVDCLFTQISPGRILNEHLHGCCSDLQEKTIDLQNTFYTFARETERCLYSCRNWNSFHFADFCLTCLRVGCNKTAVLG